LVQTTTYASVAIIGSPAIRTFSHMFTCTERAKTFTGPQNSTCQLTH
jgi:hypothetical protein